MSNNNNYIKFHNMHYRQTLVRFRANMSRRYSPSDFDGREFSRNFDSEDNPQTQRWSYERQRAANEDDITGSDDYESNRETELQMQRYEMEMASEDDIYESSDDSEETIAQSEDDERAQGSENTTEAVAMIQRQIYTRGTAVLSQYSSHVLEFRGSGVMFAHDIREKRPDVLHVMSPEGIKFQPFVESTMEGARPWEYRHIKLPFSANVDFESNNVLGLYDVQARNIVAELCRRVQKGILGESRLRAYDEARETFMEPLTAWAKKEFLRSGDESSAYGGRDEPRFERVLTLVVEREDGYVEVKQYHHVTLSDTEEGEMTHVLSSLPYVEELSIVKPPMMTIPIWSTILRAVVGVMSDVCDRTNGIKSASTIIESEGEFVDKWEKAFAGSRGVDREHVATIAKVPRGYRDRFSDVEMVTYYVEQGDQGGRPFVLRYNALKRYEAVSPNPRINRTGVQHWKSVLLSTAPASTIINTFPRERDGYGIGGIDRVIENENVSSTIPDDLPGMRKLSMVFPSTIFGGYIAFSSAEDPETIWFHVPNARSIGNYQHLFPVVFTSLEDANESVYVNRKRRVQNYEEDFYDSDNDQQNMRSKKRKTKDKGMSESSNGRQFDERVPWDRRKRTGADSGDGLRIHKDGKTYGLSSVDLLLFSTLDIIADMRMREEYYQDVIRALFQNYPVDHVRDSLLIYLDRNPIGVYSDWLEEFKTHFYYPFVNGEDSQ